MSDNFSSHDVVEAYRAIVNERSPWPVTPELAVHVRYCDSCEVIPTADERWSPYLCKRGALIFRDSAPPIEDV